MNEQYTEKLPFAPEEIFSISGETDFNQLALEIFRYQYFNNPIYQTYCKHLNINTKGIIHYKNIPFLPISFFKTHRVACFESQPEISFSSSGTTGMETSKHHVKQLGIYESSFLNAFERFYGQAEDYLILGLLPSYLEREGSSLIYMVDKLIEKSTHPDSGFFLDDHESLLKIIEANTTHRVILIGVSYALLDLAEKYNPNLSDCIIMETGGMKGKRKELIKTDLHNLLKEGLSVKEIHSEYGMTELLSQAYSIGTEFKCPPWMKILTRSYNDPFEIISEKTGGINVIDLANIYSCSFIATQDLGKVYENHFEVLGRFDHSDLRGCNLLVQ